MSDSIATPDMTKERLQEVSRSAQSTAMKEIEGQSKWVKHFLMTLKKILNKHNDQISLEVYLGSYLQSGQDVQQQSTTATVLRGCLMIIVHVEHHHHLLSS